MLFERQVICKVPKPKPNFHHHLHLHDPTALRDLRVSRLASTPVIRPSALPLLFTSPGFHGCTDIHRFKVSRYTVHGACIDASTPHRPPISQMTPRNLRLRQCNRACPAQVSRYDSSARLVIYRREHAGVPERRALRFTLSSTDLGVPARRAFSNRLDRNVETLQVCITTITCVTDRSSRCIITLEARN